MNYLDRERQNSQINSDQLADWFFCSKQNQEKWIKLQNIVNNDQQLKFKFESLSYSRPEIFIETMKRSVRYQELIGFGDPSFQFVIDQPLVGFLHRLMVVPAIKLMANDEQISRWLPHFLNYTYIGSYAQTELSHGSDVQGIQTTATYDKTKQEFVINTPNLNSMQYWQGELGVSANHAIVQANLINEGKNYGIHHFMVRVRDQQTHEPMPGIQVGDIGPKIGWMAKDNGYMIIQNVRIPRTNMLMRFSVVTKEGEYKKLGHEKMSYAAMVFSRKVIVNNSPLILGQAITIGLRYSAFRTQFKDETGKQRILLDYNAHIDKLIPLLASSFVHLKGSDFLNNLYDYTIERGNKFNDFSTLADLHGISSGMKAYYTWNAHYGIDLIRMSCGGHGYSDFSGLSALWRHHTSSVTGEGENTMIILQCARYVLNNFTLAYKNPEDKRISQFLGFFKNSQNILSSQLLKGDPQNKIKSHSIIQELLVYRIVKLASIISLQFMKFQNPSDNSKQLSFKEVWDVHAGASLVELGIIFTQYISYKSFSDSLKLITNQINKNSMEKLLRLYGLLSIIEQPLSLIEGGCINGQEIQYLREQKEYLILDIRQDVISIIDAYKFEDDTLKSALARSDGQIYQKMFELANQGNPINQAWFRKQAFQQIQNLRNVQPKL